MGYILCGLEAAHIVMAGTLPYSSIYDNIAVVEPPAGEQSNLLNPESQTSTLIAVNSITLLAMLLMLASRFWIRGRKLRNLGWDDCKAGFCSVRLR